MRQKSSGTCWLLGCLFLLQVFVTLQGTAKATVLGGNKFDLFRAYSGFAHRCDGSAACQRTTRALADKAVSDAAEAGFGFLRVGVAGWSPDETGRASELATWRTNPSAFWKNMDDMFAALDRSKIK